MNQRALTAAQVSTNIHRPANECSYVILFFKRNITEKKIKTSIKSLSQYYYHGD